MRRLIVLFLATLSAALGAAWFARNPGHFTIQWLGYEIEAEFFKLAFLLAALFLLGLFVHRIWTYLRRDLPISGERRTLRRQRKGFETLNKAMVAMAAGDAKAANRLAADAARLLPPQPLVHILSAQAARLSGDNAKAAEEYKALLEAPTGEFLGLRGLLVQAMESGRAHEALELARKAHVAEPKAAWPVLTALDLEARAGDWDAASATLEKAERLKIMDADTVKRHRAALAHCQAIRKELAGEPAAALKDLETALKLRPGFVPAALLAMRIHSAEKKPRKALQVLDKAWAAAPHPQLAQAFASQHQWETPHARYEKAKKLTSRASEHVESRILLAGAALAAERADEANELLAPLLGTSPDPRVCRLQAELLALEGTEHSADEAANWRQRAETATPPAWECTQCEARQDRWTPHCDSCGRFDSLHFDERRESVEGAALRGAHSLRLLAEPLAPPDALTEHAGE